MKKIVIFVLAILLVCVHVSASDVVYSWNSSEKKIALTFDDGPHPIYTNEILEILEEYGVKATFFVIGQNLNFWGDLITQEAAMGHEIGNHTYSHSNLKNLCENDIKREIMEAENAVLEYTSVRPRLLRPPEGKVCDTVCRIAAEGDYTVVCWSIDTRDWDHTSVDNIVNNVLSSVEVGDIILFHDFVSGKSPTPEALRRIIPALLSEGYEFVTVSELITSNDT